MSAAAARFWRVVRTGALVTVISLMLWVMAESQMVQTRTLSVQIVLVPEDEQGAGLVVRAATDTVWQRTIEVSVEGATSELDRATRQIGGKIKLVIGQQIPSETGVHDIDLRALWRGLPVIRQSGVRVAEVVPNTVRVEVDELQSLDLPVRVEMPMGVEVQGSPQSEPMQIRLTGPSGILAEMQHEGLEAVATITPEMASRLTPGRSETVRSVPIELSAALADRWETRLEPGRVDVRILLRSLTETLELPPMPVQVLVAPDEIGRFEIEIAAADRDVVGVAVTGPAESIELLRSGKVVPTAFLALSLDDLESRATSARIEVHGLPAGVRLAGTPRTVQLTIRPRGGVEPVPVVPGG